MSAPLFFDTHCHPMIPGEPDATGLPFAEYRSTAMAQGVPYLMLASAHLKAAHTYRSYANSCANVGYAAGLHPHDAAKLDENPLVGFDVFRGDAKLYAIGEIGLDYFYDFSPVDAQIKAFEYFLQLALDWNLSVIIHCRDKTPDGQAYTDCFARIRDFAKNKGRFVYHCYAGTPAYADEIYALGGLIGVTGMVTFKMSENIREIVRAAPHDRLLLETDSPYLAPVPYRGKANSSALLPLVAQTVANELKLSVEDVAQITTQNAFRFFNFKGEPVA